jgi:hypothetical protein
MKRGRARNHGCFDEVRVTELVADVEENVLIGVDDIGSHIETLSDLFVRRPRQQVSFHQRLSPPTFALTVEPVC